MHSLRDVRQIVLDTETTGINPKDGHKIIEIGCVELINRRITQNRFHVYLNPEREIDAGALEVHGISNQFLQDKPKFKDIADDLISFIAGAELIIHNAPFDTGFLNHEFAQLGDATRCIENHCNVFDTLSYARRKHPGARNSLDALCKRYNIDNSKRELHGALLDAEILAEVYLIMTGGQSSLLEDEHNPDGENERQIERLPDDRPALKIIYCTEAEQAAHEKYLEKIDKASGGACLWHS